jgi:hypothetical protein
MLNGSLPQERKNTSKPNRKKLSAQRAVMSKRIFDEFNSRSQIVAWPSDNDFIANPFFYKGQIVGLVGSFASMLTENSAEIRMSGLRSVYVTNVPSSKFQRSGDWVLFAGRVVGRYESVPHLAFVDVYLCAAQMCEDALFWTQAR